MSPSPASGRQLDELAAFALAHAGDAPGKGEGAGADAVFLFADDIEDRYLYTFADLAGAREHLADPTHGYLRCAVAWRPGPDVLSVRAQEIGSSTSFVLTRRCAPDGPAEDVVRAEGAPALLPPPGPTAGTSAEPGDPAEPADLADLTALTALEDGLERAVDSGEGLVEAEDRLRRWVGRADEGDWAATERWLRSRFPTGNEPDASDGALPDGATAGARPPGRYAIDFHGADAPTGPVAALATWDRISRQAREILGPTAAPVDGTAVGHPGSGVRLALDRASGRYELSAPLPDAGAAPAMQVLEQLYRLALTVQLETGRRAVDPQVGRYVDQLGGATWARRIGLAARAVRSFRPGRP
ncbi:hypothetical protein ADK75_31995 [Streptomyces virginiae]|uniref:Uncharacterized protein n=1 Tax=Streptomyces virginiae TaxID=1961 RepID=A0A0L8M4M2_STRVG|nr:hypothetical protein [Streptomyces virginiae]KOG45279.1 hypothetical protein ADK75_31995 [Streptomyces virginiae]